MLPLEPHEPASRQSLHGFLPYKESCADSEMVQRLEMVGPNRLELWISSSYVGLTA